MLNSGGTQFLPQALILISKDCFFRMCSKCILPYLQKYEQFSLTLEPVFFFFFFFFGTGVCTQSFMLAKQALYCLSHASSPFFLLFWRWGSWKLFSWADLKPQFSQSQPPKVGRITGVSRRCPDWNELLWWIYVFKYFKIIVPFNPEILFLRIYGEESEIHSKIDV
jgi:hypothetical protein